MWSCVGHCDSCLKVPSSIINLAFPSLSRSPCSSDHLTENVIKKQNQRQPNQPKQLFSPPAILC
jgi:hypothetical protein